MSSQTPSIEARPELVRLAELGRFQRVTPDRALTVIDLKKESSTSETPVHPREAGSDGEW
jgi:hypothetical protein